MIQFVLVWYTYTGRELDEAGAAFAEPDIAVRGLLHADLVPSAAVQVVDAAHGVHFDAVIHLICAFRYWKKIKRKSG